MKIASKCAGSVTARTNFRQPVSEITRPGSTTIDLACRRRRPPVESGS
jgi:hypothetical protein